MKRLLVVSHDAGGAEIISSWLRRHLDEWVPTLVLDGPAVGIFARKINEQSLRSLPPVSDFDFVLCGTSGIASDLERTAVRKALVAGVRCAAWIDHWTNYPVRFLTNGKFIFPDELWVCDEHAAMIAIEKLPGANIVLKGENPYLEDLIEEVRQARRRSIGLKGKARRILYVSDGNDIVRVRPHPSVAVSETSLGEDIAWADTVVGYDTMALAVAALAGRHTISLLPADAGSLPYEQIKRPAG